MEFTYTNKEERLIRIKEAEGQGLVMLHDNFTEDGGILIFEEPLSPTAEELAEEAERRKIKLIIEQLPDQGINKAWKRLLEKGILP